MSENYNKLLLQLSQASGVHPETIKKTAKQLEEIQKQKEKQN